MNDGSTDQTLNEIPDDPKILVIDRKENRGKGYSLNDGFRKASQLGAEFVITLDGDLQHPPEYIPAFLEAVQRYDMIIGRRQKSGSDMPFHRMMSNFLTSFMVNKRTGYRLHDSQSGFRAYRLEKIIDILPESDGYEAETEILIKASRKGLTVAEVEIPTIYTELPSKMSYPAAIWGFIRTIIKPFK